MIHKCKFCGHDPELKVTTYGWESEETSTYRYVCPHCGTGFGGYDSKQEALDGWNKGVELMKDM